ncbi:MAG: hypothetical protein U0T32_05575 [Chitinophagales bacterium]
MYYGKGQQLYCETCEAKMEIKSDFSALKVCVNCGQIKYKYSLASPRKVLPIAESMNVLCIGVIGFIELKKFEIIGRYQIQSSWGCYNLWCIHFADGDILEWLVESAGEYYYCQQNRDKNLAFNNKLWDFPVNTIVNIEGMEAATMILRTMIKDQDIEGELPEMPDSFEYGLLFIFEDNNKNASVLLKTPKKKVVYLLGRKLSWDYFKFEKYRKLQPFVG